MATTIPYRRKDRKAGNLPVVKRKAIYLRKSRDETQGKEDVLAKHRKICAELCEKNGWEYVVYQEIGSSDSLEERPQMMQLLDDVEDGLYDGIVVVDYDRLSRGDELDAAIIKRAFRNAGAKVITPTKVYDLEDETSELLMGVEALVARMEYRRIKRRLRRGKLEGAAMGKWVQGNPPFPYFYNSEKRRVEVDESKRHAYLWMKEMALNGISPGEIAIRLNQAGIKTNRNGAWVPETVQKVLLNPFHTGRVIYGKTKKDKEHGYVMADRNNWITGEGDHERLKTPDEHARMYELIQSRRRFATRSRGGATPLSGLVKCGLCGHTHVSTTQRGKQVIFACTNKDFATGKVCPNGGVESVAIYEAITREARVELARIAANAAALNSTLPSIETALATKRTELNREEAKLSNVFDLAISGILPKDKVPEKKDPIEATIRRLKQEIADLEEAAASGGMPLDERKQKLERLVQGFWTSTELTDRQRHTFLATLIDHIILLVDRKAGVYDISVVWR